VIIIDTALILGAGFSWVAGLPLANQLFDGEVLITSRRSEENFEEVINSWNDWKKGNPFKGAEQFISEVYLSPMSQIISWTLLVEYLTARLATPLKHDRGAYELRYAGRITRPINNPIYDYFWDILLNKFNLEAVITFNYDLIVERGLRHRQMKRKNRPGVYYGGIPLPQILKGAALPFTIFKPGTYEELTGSIPLFKLHGSLNWGQENGNLVLYQDLRAAFRRKGKAQIIPPVEEKEIPKWLFRIWESAKEVLSQAQVWFICGYSLPEYDKAVRRLFLDAVSRGKPKEILISDPAAEVLAKRWKSISPNSEIKLLPGLPDVLKCLNAMAEL